MRLPGCCALCDTRIYEVETVWPQGHPFAGQPRKLGNPLPNAVRLTLVMVSGVTGDVTVCKECEPTVNDRLSELWRRTNQRAGAEHKARFFLGGRPLTKEQNDQAERDMVATIQDVPLGIIARHK